MLLTKIFHSCILIEEQGVKILIDPGTWVFLEKFAKPEDFANVDIVLVTHEHQDHYDPQALKVICKNGARLITNTSLAAKMKAEGLSAEILTAGKTMMVKGISIRGTRNPHGLLPIPIPECMGFVIQEKVYHPGDSLDSDIRSIDVLLAPIIAPWMCVVHGVEFVKKLHPKIVVPIHDGFMKHGEFHLSQNNLFMKFLCAQRAE